MAPVRPRRSRFLRRMKRNLRFSTSKKPCLDTSAPPGAECSRHRTPEGTAETTDQRRICSPDHPALVGTADPRAGNRTDHAWQTHRAANPGPASGCQTGLKHLASHARLNLILEQNRKMAKAAGDYDRMYKPANLKIFPYVRYRASVICINRRQQAYSAV